jgi:biopolymer transport protein ExbD
MSFGRLERTPGATPMADINMTPLIDVMLVLLVIFMVTAPLMVSALRVDLPKAAGSASTSPAVLSLAVDKSGQVFVDEQPVELGALGDALRVSAQRNPATEVQLRADSSVPYGRIVELMGLAQKAGLNRIGFVAEAPPSAPR